MKEVYHTHVSSNHSYLDLKLKEVFKYRGLMWLFISRSFKVSYKQTILGPLWLFINPLLTSIVQTILFGNIAGLSTNGVPKLLFYLSGNALWTYFSACLTSNASTFTSGAALFGKVYFPRLTIPFTNIVVGIINFGIKMFLVSGILIFYVATGYVNPNWWALLLLPFILVNLGILGMGFGIIVSSLTTKYRDLSVLVGFGMRLWMYATPVVYPLSTVKDVWLLKLILANPVTASIELYRYALLGTGYVMPTYLIISVAVTVAVALIGIVIFNRIERNFMDTV